MICVRKMTLYSYLKLIAVTPPLSSLPQSTTAIADTGASGLYLTFNAPTTNLNTSAPPIIVGTTT